jgi:hypothetical protein
VGKAFICALALAGCGTVGLGTPPSADRVNQVLTQVLAAEAEPMTVEARAFQLRRQARREYHEAGEAASNSQPELARRLLDRAEVDAQLAVALARQESFSQEARERTVMLQELQAAPAPGGSR